MDRLPKEVLINIFKHLPQESLLRLSQVCTMFRALIDKYEFIDHLYIKSQADDSSVPYRRYHKATVRSFSPLSQQKVFDAKGSELTSLTFSRCTLNLVDVVNILRATPNVKNLTFYYVRIDDETIPALELPKLDITKLVFSESDPQFFRALMKSSLQSVKLEFFGDTPYSNFGDFVGVLKQQELLKSFEMSGIYESNMFMIPMGQPKYRLKAFLIDNCDLEEWELLDNYLCNHFSSLEKLVVKNVRWDPSTTANQCANLKSFQCERVEVNSLSVLPSVTEVSIKPAFGILDKFPGVRKLNVCLTVPETFQIISRTMRHLEQVEITFGGVAGLEAPAVKKLKLSSIDSPITGGFFAVHNQIEDLTLSNIFTVDDSLLESVTSHLASLRVLRILGDNHLTARAFSIIKDNCHELKVFEMTKWDQKFRKESWSCLYQMNGLKIFTEKFD